MYSGDKALLSPLFSDRFPPGGTPGGSAYMQTRRFVMSISWKQTLEAALPH